MAGTWQIDHPNHPNDPKVRRGGGAAQCYHRKTLGDVRAATHLESTLAPTRRFFTEKAVS